MCIYICIYIYIHTLFGQSRGAYRVSRPARHEQMCFPSKLGTIRVLAAQCTPTPVRASKRHESRCASHSSVPSTTSRCDNITSSLHTHQCVAHIHECFPHTTPYDLSFCPGLHHHHILRTVNIFALIQIEVGISKSM